MTLYLKYRPTEFSEMLGNESTIQALESAIDKENHSHVYLFSGPPGTGKTTAARIMAVKLGASELDIREINSANSRGIDTAREITQQMRMLPMSGSCVVYILDECHRWTADFSNAMLKPLEDTPEHVYFFLCTTDPQKLIKPLKSRCTEVKFESLSVEYISKLLRRINKKEGTKVSKEHIEQIAENSEGCPRKAIVILERLIALDDEISREQYLKTCNVLEDEKEVIELCRALLNDKQGWSEIAKLVKELNANGKLDDPERVRYAVLGYMNAVLLSGKKMPRAISAMEAFSEPTYNTGKFGITLACISTII